MHARRLSPRPDRRGMALVAALAALTVLSLLIAGVYQLTNSDARASTNRAQSTAAIELADAGISHTLGLLRGPLADTSVTRLLKGWDNVGGSADDGRLTGYNLSADLAIPDTGRLTSWGRFYVQLLDDPADADSNSMADANGRLVIRCRSVTPDSATATIDAVVGSQVLPAVAVGGDLSMPGSPTLVGSCGGVHTNRNLSIAGDARVTMQGVVTSTGTTTVNGQVRDTLGNRVTPVTNQPALNIPVLDPMSFCSGHADYYLQADGYVRRASDNSLTLATNVAAYGFKRSSANPVVWVQSGPAFSGTYCVTGNVEITGNPGSTNAPVTATLLVSGSVNISGNPYMRPAYGGISIIAAGDLALSGDGGSGSANQSGLVYAGAQCSVNGNITITGQLVCANGTNPTGSNNYVSSNSVNGNPRITYNCAGSVAFGTRRLLYWYPRIQ
jgi:cytoskeletal protein CcmA (bactofilin family)